MLQSINFSREAVMLQSINYSKRSRNVAVFEQRGIIAIKALLEAPIYSLASYNNG
jgi:hypothetical protein